MSEIGFILSRLIHSLLFSHVAYSWNFHISRSASASSLLNSLCTHYTINLIQRFWPTQAKTQAENLCIASHLTHNSVIVSSSFPASDVSHMANKTHAEQSDQSDEDSEETETSQQEKPMSVNIITAERFQISVRLTQ